MRVILLSKDGEEVEAGDDFCDKSKLIDGTADGHRIPATEFTASTLKQLVAWSRGTDRFEWPYEFAELLRCANFFHLDQFYTTDLKAHVSALLKGGDFYLGHLRGEISSTPEPMRQYFLGGQTFENFCVLREFIEPTKHNWHEQLRNLLHNSPYAQSQTLDCAKACHDRVLDIQRKLIEQTKEHPLFLPIGGEVLMAEFSPDYKYVYTLEQGRPIAGDNFRVYSLSKVPPVRVMDWPGVVDFNITENNSLVISRGKDDGTSGSIELWDLDIDRGISTMIKRVDVTEPHRIHSSNKYTLAVPIILQDERVRMDDREVRLCEWPVSDAEDGGLKLSPTAKTAWQDIEVAKFLPDSSLFCTTDKSIEIRSSAGTVSVPKSAHLSNWDTAEEELLVSPDGNVKVCANCNCMLLWWGEDLQKSFIVYVDDRSEFMHAAFSPDSKHLAVVFNEAFRVFRVEEQSLTEVFRSVGPSRQTPSWSPDGRFLLVIPDRGIGPDRGTWRGQAMIVDIPKMIVQAHGVPKFGVSNYVVLCV